MSEIGLCRCGCGKTTPVARRNRYDLGHVKGEHIPYLSGHNSLKLLTPEKFWANVFVDSETGCWTGGINLPLVSNGKIERKKHRVAWILTNDEIPKGINVLHKCDNPPCFNPEHLFLGTQADNIRDMDSKGRRGYAKIFFCGGTIGRDSTRDLHSIYSLLYDRREVSSSAGIRS